MKTVRDGRRVWPYCPECGCRLSIKKDGPKYWVQHWWGEVTRVSSVESIVHNDRRGHSCSKLLEFWMLEKEVLSYLGV